MSNPVDVAAEVGTHMDKTVRNLSMQLEQGSTTYGGTPEGTARVLDHLERTLDLRDRMNVIPEPVEDDE